MGGHAPGMAPACAVRQIGGWVARLTDRMRDLLPPSLRYGVRRTVTDIRGHVSRARVWRWERVLMSAGEGFPFQIACVGRGSVRWIARDILGLGASMAVQPWRGHRSPRTVVFSEAPSPGTLRVPWRVHSVVTLGRAPEEILGGYDAELRRRLRKLSADARTRRIVEDAEIERVNRDMLEYYGTARHEFPVNFSLDEVRRLALVLGRLDLVVVGEEEIACHLGFDLVRKGKRYWVTSRFGYPQAVVSDAKRLRDANSANAYLALRWAIENRYDYYSMGSCKARPDDGLLQWKRRRGGAVDTLLNEGFFFVRLPEEDQARFLWGTPLFAVERGKLTLRLGLPTGPSDEETIARYREMGFQGLARVLLHCARPPGDSLLQALRGLYARQALPPEVVTLGTT